MISVSSRLKKARTQLPLPFKDVGGLAVPADDEPLPALKDQVAVPVHIPPELVLQGLCGPCGELQAYI